MAVGERRANCYTKLVCSSSLVVDTFTLGEQIRFLTSRGVNVEGPDLAPHEKNPFSASFGVIKKIVQNKVTTRLGSDSLPAPGTVGIVSSSHNPSLWMMQRWRVADLSPANAKPRWFDGLPTHTTGPPSTNQAPIQLESVPRERGLHRVLHNRTVATNMDEPKVHPRQANLDENGRTGYGEADSTAPGPKGGPNKL
ncbi:hypothetical protein VNO77_08042 [Canavalia gladiata]|uniref:Uncharacterized protein n=1 Tax=Canavalia gladiata TaxID=3824 RepID=A0AAN9M9N9_CANGL